MAKTDIYFDNKKYTVDEQSLASASVLLKSHLSTVMNGSGATISLDDTVYNISSTKLSDATNVFTSYLNTIKGNGHKVVIGGVEYGIDSAKVAGAISELHDDWSGLGEERLGGDGAEYYTLAPTALSFRSTAPLNELQEVQINGVTVDPANYTLEEGSTIVTFPIDYLKTLDVGSYEVAVASDSKTVKGDFSVKAPELNEHGFYYNQPYAATVAALGGNCVFFFRENGTMDFLGVDNGYSEVATFTCDIDSVCVMAQGGIFNGIIDANGMEIYCEELGATFTLASEFIVADNDFLYIYKEDLGGYEVTAIDKTKISYGDIKTGINDYPTVLLSAAMFVADQVNSIGNVNMTTAPKIPNSVITIGDGAFYGCTNLTSVSIPDSVMTIGREAFYECRNLENVKIGNGVTTIGNNAFNGCPHITNVYISDMASWCNILFDNATASPLTWKNNLFLNGELVTKLVIPEGVTNIGQYAFNNCTFTSVTINNSVKTIGDFAFDNCTNLESVMIGNSVTTIGYNAFFNCHNITSITFNGTIEQWNAITLGTNWNENVPATHVQCSDGQVAL